MQFICELLKQDNGKSAIVLQQISDNDVNMVIYLYEVFHIIHAMVSIFKIKTKKNSFCITLRFFHNIKGINDY